MARERSTHVPRLLALDVDGTLLDAKHRITPRTIDALGRARAHGVIVAIATGRPVEVIGEPGEHADWLIGSNGATVVSAGEGAVLVDRAIDIAHAREIVGRIRSVVRGVGFSVISETDVVSESGFERIVPPGVNMGRRVIDAFSEAGITGSRVRSWAAFHPELGVDEIARLIDPIVAPRLTARSMGFGAAEISLPNITKATGLQSLVEHLDLSPDHVWAFGDGVNDHEMLEWAGVGHAMGNADPATKSKAHVVVASHDDHGVAETIEQLLATQFG